MNKYYLKIIRNSRIEKGYTQEYVSCSLGITQKAYSDIENGKAILKRIYIMKLSEILEIMPSDLCYIYNTCNTCKSKNDELIFLLKANAIDIPLHLR